MPNWCSCELIITGPFEDREKLVKHVYNNETLSVFAFQKIIPPKKDWDNETWIRIYGMKWDCAEASLSVHTSTESRYRFLTAWEPPNHNAMSALATSFPTLYFKLHYAERGMEFYGFWYGDSKLCKKLTSQFKETDFEIKDELLNKVLRPNLQHLYETSG